MYIYCIYICAVRYHKQLDRSFHKLQGKFSIGLGQILSYLAGRGESWLIMAPRNKIILNSILILNIITKMQNKIYQQNDKLCDPTLVTSPPWIYRTQQQPHHQQQQQSPRTSTTRLPTIHPYHPPRPSGFSLSVTMSYPLHCVFNLPDKERDIFC